MTAGLVVLQLGGTEAADALAAAARTALAATPPGRFLCVLWPVPLAWVEEPPIEAIIAATLLGRPETRREDADEAVTLHANLVVRSYRDDALIPCRCFQVLVLRRAGPKLIDRRKAPGGAPETAARIDTTRPAFTRDWANTVWHVRDDGAEDRIVARLARLLRWPDEAVIRLRPGADAENRVALADMGGDLVGVPERYPLAPSAAFAERAEEAGRRLP